MDALKTQLAHTLAHTLKSLRKQRSWSLDQASQKTGVSKAMLGQIERGESSPTMATLWKIAHGFEVSFSSFIESSPVQETAYMHPKVGLRPMHKQKDRIRIISLFPYDVYLGFEVFVIELLPGYEHYSPSHQKGVVEHVMGARGTIEIKFSNKWYSVKENEGLRFKADRPHAYRNRSASKVVFHNIVYYPKT